MFEAAQAPQSEQLRMIVMALPDPSDSSGQHFTFRDFIECSDTWWRTRVDNTPRQSATFDAMRRMTEIVLDPLAEKFACPVLTYAFASSALVKRVTMKRCEKEPFFPNVTPHGDQHASCELNRNGKPICPRLGIAVDLYVPGYDSREIAKWLVINSAFDRLYFYDAHRPFHVSVGPENSRYIAEMKGFRGGPHHPRTIRPDRFLEN